MVPLKSERVEVFAKALLKAAPQNARAIFEPFAEGDGVTMAEMEQEFVKVANRVSELRRVEKSLRYMSKPSYVYKSSLTCREQARLSRGFDWYSF